MFGLGIACCETDKCIPGESAFRDLVMEPINAILDENKKKGINACLKYHTFWSVMHGLISIKMLSYSEIADELNKMVLDDAIEGFIKKPGAINFFSFLINNVSFFSVVIFCLQLVTATVRPGHMKKTPSFR